MKTRLSRNSLRFVCAAFALSVWACKPVEEAASDKKGLEALESGDQNQRQDTVCGGPRAATVEEAIHNVYRTLPAGLRVVLDTRIDSDSSGDLAGSEMITAKGHVAQLCYKVLKEQSKTSNMQGEIRLNSVKGCWRGREVDGRAYPQIYMEEDIQAIYDGLIPMVVYGVVELYFDHILASAVGDISESTEKALSKKEKSLASFYKDFVNLRTELAKSFTADLKSAQTTTALSEYGKLYGDGFVENRDFQNFVMAELFDAYYCSEQTRSAYQTATGLGKTQASFQKVRAFFGD